MPYRRKEQLLQHNIFITKVGPRSDLGPTFEKTMKDYQVLQKRFIVDTYVNRGLTLVKGNGVYVYDEHDTAYLDLMSNYGVNILGHNHPEVTKALIDQLQTITTLHGSFANDKRVQAAQLLVKRAGGNIHQVFFSSSGAEAIEAALKFAVLKAKKKRFIVADHGYHGKTLGALSATAALKYQAPFIPLLWDFQTIPFNDIEALSRAITPETAAFIVEPIQGEGGIYLPDTNYLKSVRELCDKHEILLIIDEIQTGCGRTGTFLASKPSSIHYDILCLGKGLAGGIPIGATLVSENVALAIPKHIHTSTFGGNPLASAGIVATLNVLNDGFLQSVSEKGTYFIEQLNTISSPLITQVRGKGLMIGIQVTDKRNELLKLIQHAHMLVIPAGDDVIRLLPPLIIEKKEIDNVVKTLSNIFNSL